MAAAVSAGRFTDGGRTTHRATGTGRGWQILRNSFKEFLVNQPPKHAIGSAAAAVALFLGVTKKDDTGPSKDELREAEQDRVLENIIATLNKESAEGKLAEERWLKARDANVQVRDACKSMGFSTTFSPGRGRSGEYGSLDEFMGVKGTADAAALYPADWCRLLTEELIADLAVDAVMGPLVDAFVDGAVELLTIHEGWTLDGVGGSAPQSGALGKSSSSPTLRRANFSTELLDESVGSSLSQSVQLPDGPQQSQSPRLPRPLLPPVWKQQNRLYQSMPPNDGLSPSSSSGYSGSSGFATRPGRYSVRGGRGTGNNGDGWTLRQFHACKPLDPYLKRIQVATEQQRPRQRLRRVESDPLGPKQSLPMLATNFPEVWEKTAPLKMKLAEDAGATAATAAEGQDEEWEDEEPKGYTWLQRKGRDGKTVFPYSLVSHKAFIESQPNPLLKAKVLEIAPMRFSDSW
eukprot:TRINITY_DN5704_c0_g1_i1.p1 TRINITY_DN5704_c0_g1~~TRINITY_DN5704_c0_g1_i1.p1  ORF type:complete len:474 (+),score=96.88 TRINITY_DN5704_c0_g1_i1:37-1422(+)